jgi:hypothetical protein
MRTVGQYIAAARGLIQDQVPPYRYPTNDLALYVAEALAETRRVRPDLFFGASRADLPVYTVDSVATVVPIPDNLFSAVTNYVAGRAEMRDDTFATDGRAMTLIGAFGVALTANKGGR